MAFIEIALATKMEPKRNDTKPFSDIPSESLTSEIEEVIVKKKKRILLKLNT